MPECELDECALNVDAELAERPERAELSGVVGCEHGVLARDVPADHRDRRARAEHERRRLGVGPDVELRDRRDVPDGVGGAAHHHERVQLRDDVGSELERARDVRQRAERHERQLAGPRPNGLDKNFGGIAGGGLAAVQLEPDVAHAIRAVHVVRELLRTRARHRGARVHWHSGAHEVTRVERVLDGEVERHVAGDDSDRLDLYAGMPQRHQQRDRVVGRGVRVDQKAAANIWHLADAT